MMSNGAPQLSHEKLQVYQRGLKFASWKESLFAQVARQVSVLDHLDRASESIPESIANGNSRRSKGDRNRYFDIAMGSGLECAACLDVCECKDLISTAAQVEGKQQLRHIVRMIMGLRSATSSCLREKSSSYVVNQGEQTQYLFSHEKLDVYQEGLALVRWIDEFLQRSRIPTRYSDRLDKMTTSFVLNIAEGNGRASDADHRRFLDIAHTCAMKTASSLDLLVVKDFVCRDQIVGGKQILAGLVPLLMGLRKYLS